MQYSSIGSLLEQQGWIGSGMSTSGGNHTWNGTAKQEALEEESMFMDVVKEDFKFCWWVSEGYWGDKVRWEQVTHWGDPRRKQQEGKEKGSAFLEHTYLNCEQQSYVSVAVKIEDHLTVSSWGLNPQAWCLFVSRCMLSLCLWGLFSSSLCPKTAKMVIQIYAGEAKREPSMSVNANGSWSFNVVELNLH